MALNKEQKAVMELLKKETPKEELQPWIRGYIPNHYKRITIGKEEALELAKVGAVLAMSRFYKKPFFTQALLIGVCLASRYRTVTVVTPSQYGKSWTLGMIALLLADKQKKIRVVGNTETQTANVMDAVLEHIQTLAPEIKTKLFGTLTRAEKLVQSTAKDKIAFKGGSIEALSVKGTSSNPLTTQMMGKSGIVIVDEAALIDNDRYSEMGRRQVSNKEDIENSELFIEISNPHQKGVFYDHLTTDTPEDDSIVIWADVLTACEEGNYLSSRVPKLDFFNNRSTCKRYLLCELEEYSEESMFEQPRIDDNPEKHDLTYCLGIDSAYTGKDSIIATLSGVDAEGNIRLVSNVNLSKGTWEVGKTSVEVVNRILAIVYRYQVKVVTIDIGFGTHIIEPLALAAQGFLVIGVNFASSTTKARRSNGVRHFSAVYGTNKRSEMYLDMSQLIKSDNLYMTTALWEEMKESMQHTKTLNRGAKIGVIPKDDIKLRIGKSPDELDSAVLSVHAIMLYLLSSSLYLYGEEDEDE